MSRRVREDRFDLFEGYTEIRSDLGFIETGFPILDNVIDGHAHAFQHWAPTLHARLHFNERAIRPVHHNSQFNSTRLHSTNVLRLAGSEPQLLSLWRKIPAERYIGQSFNMPGSNLHIEDAEAQRVSDGDLSANRRKRKPSCNSGLEGSLGSSPEPQRKSKRGRTLSDRATHSSQGACRSRRIVVRR